MNSPMATPEVTLRRDGEHLHVALRDRFDERTDFSRVDLAGYRRVTFDTSQIVRINSFGVRQWIMFLRELPRELRYDFERASVEFIKHCNMVADMLGRGTVSSFYAPYVCDPCKRDTEQLLEVASLSRAVLKEPPGFRCPECGGPEELDEVPARYFAFINF
jgi:hypothetical protein